MSKGKKRKVTITNLSTGEVIVHYLDPNKRQDIPEKIQSLLDQQKRVRAAVYSPALQSLLDQQKRIKAAVYSPALQSLLDQQKRIKAAVYSPAGVLIETLKPYKAWHTELSKKPKYYTGLYETLKSLSFVDTIGRIGEIAKQQNRVRELVKEYLESEQPMPVGVAREIFILGEHVKSSNFILGMVCYFAGYFTTEKVKNFLTGIDIEPTPNLIREVQRNREKAKQIKIKSTKPDFKISARKINRLCEALENCIKILRGLKLSGKMETRKLIKRMEDLQKGY